VSFMIVAALPAFNEEVAIGSVVLRALKHVDKVIVVDDGSSDKTSEVARSAGALVVRHERNMGYGAAIQSSFKRARELDADAMVTLDADGQHDPDDIPTLIRPILEGSADVIVGSRFLRDAKRRGDVPLYRRLGIRAITGLSNFASNYGVSDAQSGFRAYGRKALEELRLCDDGMGVSAEILLRAGDQNLRVVEVPVGCSYRGLEMTSTQDPLRHGTSVVMSIVRLVVEDRPLLFLGVPGVLSLLIGAFFGVWMLRIYAVEHQIATNVALASIAFILIGLFAAFTAITLYAISRLMQKTR